MTPDQIRTLAKQANGTPYVNRHYPGEMAVAFGPGALIEFVRLVREAVMEEAAVICDELTEIPASEPRHCAQDIRIRSFAK